LSLSFLLSCAQAFAIVMSVAFVLYVCLIIVPYLRHRPAWPGDPALFQWHFFVPCRDEGLVIGDTIRYLRTRFPTAHVWVIDDHSDDRTLDIVTWLQGSPPRPDPNLHVVVRRRPNARTGKSDALNAAYRALRGWVGRHGDVANTIVVVVDADGRPAENCLYACAADHLFGDPAVGAVQIDVRMSNRGTAPGTGNSISRRFRTALVRMQDLEFRTAIAAIQMSRGFTGSIAMGGNGQFTRLSALDSVAGPQQRPWRGSLLEDFELGVHLLTEGWKTGFTVDTHVAQEGLYSMRRFLAQRTRWSQGTMQCARYARRIWRSRHLSTLGAAEMLYYLAQPWMQLLGSVVYPIPLAILAVYTVDEPAVVWAWFTDGAWKHLLMYGVLGLLPFLIWGPIYRKHCEPGAGPLRGIAYGLGYACYIYTFYITVWRAVFRLARGRNGWAKTRRNTEHTNSKVVALDQ
jgi:cellulose synthase/poly-beta-1,6-N-acetylglucosamine synthase-like glycosyltransferase